MWEYRIILHRIGRYGFEMEIWIRTNGFKFGGHFAGIFYRDIYRTDIYVVNCHCCWIRSFGSPVMVWVRVCIGSRWETSIVCQITFPNSYAIWAILCRCVYVHRANLDKPTIDFTVGVTSDTTSCPSDATSKEHTSRQGGQRQGPYGIYDSCILVYCMGALLECCPGGIAVITDLKP